MNKEMAALAKKSAVENLGPQLLGRIPSEPDSRNWNAAEFLGDDISLRDSAVAELKRTTVGYTAFGTRKPASNTHWAKGFAFLSQIGPSPTPPPPPSPSGAIVWEDVEAVLDQGQTPHCVGFGGAQFGNTNPVDDKYTNDDGHAIYYECKVIDGEPNAEDGSSVHSLARVLKNRGRIGAYAWASDTATIIAWLRSKGPVVVGTDWYNDMFYPDASGLVTPTGGIAGGHCFVCVGVNSDGSILEFLNSWSQGWAKKGHFYIKTTDFQNKLLNANGEAVTTMELPV
jgi:hypothetical protein